MSPTVSPYWALWALTIGMEAALAALLIRRGSFRQLPIFFTYILWEIISDSLMILIKHYYADAIYFRSFFVEAALDSVVQFAVLVELIWSVLRPLRTTLPRGAIFVVTGGMLLVALAVWPLAGISSLSGLSANWHLLFRLEQTLSLLRIIFFLVIAGFSQLLVIGWRDRELQVATGLGFYSLVSIGATLLQAHQVSPVRYELLDLLPRAAYLVSVLYWVVSFAQQEAVRQEFNPKVQVFLTQLAGTARAQRVALDDPGKRRPRN